MISSNSWLSSTGTLILLALGTACDAENASRAPSADPHLGYAVGDTGFTAAITGGANGLSTWVPSAGTDLRYPPAQNLDGLPIDLGEARRFVILAKSGISTVPTSAITGNIAVSPAAASYLTGFSLTADPTNVFSTSPQVTGKVFASDYAPPAPTHLTTVISNMETAFTDGAGRAPDVTELGAGNIGGLTLDAGVYQWGTGLLIPTDLTLTGSGTDVWIFQVAGDLTVASATQVVLAGGAEARNVFWVVSGLVEFGTTSQVQGTVLGQTSITLRTGASVRGRLLSQTYVDVDASTVAMP